MFVKKRDQMNCLCSIFLLFAAARAVERLQAHSAGQLAGFGRHEDTTGGRSKSGVGSRARSFVACPYLAIGVLCVSRPHFRSCPRDNRSGTVASQQLRRPGLTIALRHACSMAVLRAFESGERLPLIYIMATEALRRYCGRR